MSEHRLSDEALRGAFQQRRVPLDRECTPEDLERVWRALDGELPAAERRELVERLAVDPALAEAWRVGHRLRQREAGDAGAEPPASRWWSVPRVAAAAVVILAATAALGVWRDRTGSDTYRDTSPFAIESLVEDDAVLPREAFRLRWSPGPPDARYQVRVTTEDLQLIAAASDLDRAEMLVNSADLAAVPAGARVLWQVEALLPGGDRVVSATFVVRAAGEQ